MNSIASCLGTALALVLIVLALAAWRGRVMLKLGLRPIPRRRVQSALIVFGLMLATLIITAAFVMGDTMSHTIRSLTLDSLGEIDEVIRVGGGTRSFGAGATQSTYFKLARYEELSAALADYERVDMIVPAVRESIPAVNTTRGRSTRALPIMGLRAGDVDILLTDELTDAGGNPLRLADLGPREVFLNAPAAEELAAEPGDKLDLYAESRPTAVFVRGVAVGGEDARLIMPFRRAQTLFGQRGKLNSILISNAGDAAAGAEHSVTVTSNLRGLLSDRRVAARIVDLLSYDGSAADALRAEAVDRRGNVQADLLALADGLESGTLDAELLSLLADEGLSDELQSVLADAKWRSEPARDRLEDLFADLSELGVDDVKRDNLDEGELVASAFTTIFVVTGLFGIAAGLLLIFLIFVLLAAERKSEMGMTRAIGGQRRHLVQMFVFEGTAYDLAAAGVGVALGVLVGILLVYVLGRAFASQSDIAIRPYLSARSLIVSYALGMLMTFGTVVFAAYKVSRLNIVAAVRDLPEPPPPPTRLRDRLLAPFRTFAAGFRSLRRRRIGRALWTWLVNTPLSLLGVAWAGFAGGPLTLLLGLALTPVGAQQSSGALFTLGASFAIIGAGLVLRALLGAALRKQRDLVDRITFTFMGLGLTIFWSLPSDVFERVGVKDLKSGPEMLFISGIMLVAGAVMVIMYNTDLLLRAILSLTGGARRMAPVLRMAIAYPLANRFRTGLTLGMFAVVIFSVVFMATAFKVNDAFFADTDRLTGGFDLRAESSQSNPVPDLAEAIADSRYLDRRDYPVVAAQSSLSAELRQGDGRWGDYRVYGVDAAYLENVGYDLAVLAEGYQTTEEVWLAVRDHPGYGVIDALAVPSRQASQITIGGPEFKIEGVYIEDDTMLPLDLEVRDPISEATFNVTIIGVIEQGNFSGFGLYTSQQTLDDELPSVLTPTTHFIQLADGVDPTTAGADLESALVKHGLQAVDQVAEIKEQQEGQQVVQSLLQGFLTLGLVVGVAALGVVSTRAVVERRQQIGMLRALGFQREMVGWSFVLESSFVALLGITLGTGLAFIPAYQMIDELSADIPGLTFQVPWGSILLVVGLAYVMALLTTWLPAAQASRVSPAEALRYE